MSIATREEILAHLATLLASVPGVTGVYRDRGDFATAQLPIIVLLDGAEEIATDMSRQNSVKMPPAVFTLKPEIVLIAKPRDDLSNTTPTPIGPELSEWRDKILAAIINDATLAQMVTDNGNIRYLGCSTDMQWGASLSGALQMNFAFNYVWLPPTA